MVNIYCLIVLAKLSYAQIREVMQYIIFLHEVNVPDPISNLRHLRIKKHTDNTD